MKRCPYCNEVIEFEDFDQEFENFEDCGNYIVATGSFECQCGETLKIKANFVWDEEIEIS